MPLPYRIDWQDTAQADLPFILVQIGRWVKPNGQQGDSWETVREQQRQVAEQMPGVRMVSEIGRAHV